MTTMSSHRKRDSSFLKLNNNVDNENLGEIGIDRVQVNLALDRIKTLSKMDARKWTAGSSYPPANLTKHSPLKFDVGFRFHDNEDVMDTGVLFSVAGLSITGFSTSIEMERAITVVGTAMYDIDMTKRVNDKKKLVALYNKGLTQIFINGKYDVYQGDDLVAILPSFDMISKTDKKEPGNSTNDMGYANKDNGFLPLVIVPLRELIRERAENIDWAIAHAHYKGQFKGKNHDEIVQGIREFTDHTNKLSLDQKYFVLQLILAKNDSISKETQNHIHKEMKDTRMMIGREYSNLIHGKVS